MSENSSFDSLNELRSEHGILLRASKEPASSGEQHAESIEDKVVKFLARARATGAVLDFPADRDAAQSVLDYWTATLFTLPNGVSAAKALPSVIPGVAADAVNLQLEAFDPSTIDDSIRAADAWLATPGVDRRLVRRFLLRLVRMPADKLEFDHVPTVRGSLYDLDTETTINELIDQLATVGVVRVTKSESIEMDRVSLRSPELLKRWQELRDCCAERSQFRSKVSAWESSGRPKDNLLTGPDLDEVRAYHDRNMLERDFINDSVDHQAASLKQAVIDRRMMYLSLALAILAIIGWVGTAANYNSALKARKTIERRKQFTDLRRLVRTLSEVATATEPQQLELARLNWDRLVKEIGNTEPFRSSLNFDSLRNTVVDSTSNTNFLSDSDLQKIRELRNKLVDSNSDKSSIRLARDQSFSLVEISARGIVDTLTQGKPIGDAEPFIREFWTQYWGEMLLFEEGEVAQAMVDFGGVLSQIRSEVENPSDELKADAKDLYNKYLKGDEKTISRILQKPWNASTFSQLKQEYADIPDHAYNEFQSYIDRRIVPTKLVTKLQNQLQNLLGALVKERSDESVN